MKQTSRLKGGEKTDQFENAGPKEGQSCVFSRFPSVCVLLKNIIISQHDVL